ncbi:MAG: hypothetical protein ACM3SR_14910 [Ignavibacteriales bacterium]
MILPRQGEVKAVSGEIKNGILTVKLPFENKTRNI